MTLDELLPFRDDRPFVPFRLHLDDGTTLSVRHRELIMLGRQSVIVGINANPEKKHYRTIQNVSLSQIARAERMPTQS